MGGWQGGREGQTEEKATFASMSMLLVAEEYWSRRSHMIAQYRWAYGAGVLQGRKCATTLEGNAI